MSRNGLDARSFGILMTAGVNAQQIQEGRAKREAEHLGLTCRGLSVVDHLLYSSNEIQLTVAPIAPKFNPLMSEEDFSDDHDKKVARDPLAMAPVALALRSNRTDNILSSLHSLGKSVTDFHRQVSEVLPGRYHVQTLGLSADESFLAGYVLNRGGTVAELILDLGKQVSSGHGAIDNSRILQKLPATVAVVNVAAAGAFTAESALQFIPDLKTHTLISSSVTTVREAERLSLIHI